MHLRTALVAIVFVAMLLALVVQGVRLSQLQVKLQAMRAREMEARAVAVKRELMAQEAIRRMETAVNQASSQKSPPSNVE
jgi:hypothetical protein